MYGKESSHTCSESFMHMVMRLSRPSIDSKLLDFSLKISYDVCSYWDVPTFGCDTIRKFSNNVSGLTKLAVRDFEDLLQVTVLFYILAVFVHE